MFKVGQMVKCVDNLGAEELTEGKEYIVSWIRPTNRSILVYGVIILGNYIAFKNERFAPLQDNFAENVLSKALKQGKELHERIYV